MLCNSASHPWKGALHPSSGVYVAPLAPFSSGWANNFFALYGGTTAVINNGSTPGWGAGDPLAVGSGFSPDTNNVADILQNSKVVIHWGLNEAFTFFSATAFQTNRQNSWLQQFKDAGITQIFVDPYMNDTMAIYGDKWYPILPETDEALLQAIAYVLINENLYDSSFVTTHVLGFSNFKDEIMGASDKTPKTPAGAANITGVDSETITALAHLWASHTFVMCCWAGATNRRNHGGTWVRMLRAVCALLGNYGVSGRGMSGGTRSGVQHWRSNPEYSWIRWKRASNCSPCRPKYLRSILR